jgi:hypothetical protein
MLLFMALLSWLSLYVYLVVLALFVAIGFQFILCTEYISCFVMLFADFSWAPMDAKDSQEYTVHRHHLHQILQDQQVQGN